MKTIILTLISSLCIASVGFGQMLIKNDGATIKVQPGATLFVEGGIENTAGATIENDGTINLEGDFLNNGTYDATDANTLRFSGDQGAIWTPGTVTGTNYKTVEIAKTGDAVVTMAGAAGIATGIAFSEDGNRVQLGANDLSLMSGATMTGHNATHFFVTDGAGALVRNGLAAGSHDFPVGFEATTYNPAILNVDSGSDDYTVRAAGTPTDLDGESGTAYTAGVVDASWNITNVSNTSTDVTLQWATTDELIDFDRNNSAVAKNDGTGWDLSADDISAAVGVGAGLYTQTRNNITSFSHFAVGGEPLASTIELTLDLWLEGPYNGTDLNDDIKALIPNAEPYTALGYTQKAFGGGETTDMGTINTNNATDWVLVEFRDKTDNKEILGTKSGLLLNSGMVANADGTIPFTMKGLAADSYFVVVKHRNHLAAISAAAVDMSSGSAIFSFKGNAGVQGGALAQKDLGSGAFGLIQGDADSDGAIGPTDRSLIFNDRLMTTYLRTDANLNGNVDPTDRSNAFNNRLKTTSVPTEN